MTLGSIPLAQPLPISSLSLKLPPSLSSFLLHLSAWVSSHPQNIPNRLTKLIATTGFTFISEDSSEIMFLLIENYKILTLLPGFGWVRNFWNYYNLLMDA